MALLPSVLGIISRASSLVSLDEAGVIAMHKHKSSLQVFNPFLSLGCPSCVQRGDLSACHDCECWVCFTRPPFVALYQSAGSVSLWLINV